MAQQRDQQAPVRAGYGRYWNRSMTTSTSLCGGAGEYRKKYRFMRTRSVPGIGTPDVNSCCATSGAGGGRPFRARS